MPEIFPVEVSKVSPSGNVPDMLYVIGSVPVTLRDEEYCSLRVALARVPEIFGAIPLTLREKFCVTVPAEFSALTFTVNFPADVGLPEIRPVFALMLSPFGSPSADHVNGLVPFALIVTL